MAQQLTDTQKAALETRCKAEFQSSHDLQEEFGSLAIYTAFKMAEAQGQVFISAPSQTFGGR